MHATKAKKTICRGYKPHISTMWQSQKGKIMETVKRSKVTRCYVYAAAAAAKSLQPCPTLCDPIDGSPPGSPIPGILQARTLEWVAISFFNSWKWKVKSESEVAQSCLTLSDPMDSSIHGKNPRLLHPWDSPGKSTGVGCHSVSGYEYENGE